MAIESLNLIKIFLLGILGFLTSLFLIPVYLKLAIKFNLLDKPQRKGTPIANETLKEKEGTPTMGGIVIWLPPIILALVLLFLKNIFGGVFDYLNFVTRRETYLPLAGLFLGGILGLVDDLIHHFEIGPHRGFSRKETFLIYLSIAIIFAWWFITKLNINFIELADYRFYPGIIFFALYFIFIFLAVTLSTDIIDGMDGLFGGTTFTIILVLTIFAFLNQDYNLASFGSILLGSLLAYLWFNFYPAKFFDGNNGSMSVGVAIALMSFLTGSTLLLPFIALIFLIESGSVVIQVFSKRFFRRKIFLSTPIHHHFKSLGWHEANLVVRFWIINIIGGMIGLVIFLIFKFL